LSSEIKVTSWNNCSFLLGIHEKMINLKSENFQIMFVLFYQGPIHHLLPLISHSFTTFSSLVRRISSVYERRIGL